MPSTVQHTPNKQALGSAAHTLKHTHTHNRTLAHPLGEKVKPLGFNQKLRVNQKEKRKENAGEKSIPNRSNGPGFLWDYVDFSY